MVQAATAEGRGLVSVRVSDMFHNEERPYEVNGSDTAEDAFAFVVSLFSAVPFATPFGFVCFILQFQSVTIQRKNE